MNYGESREITSVSTETTVDKLFHRLQQEIVEGRIATGSKLSEPVIAKEYGGFGITCNAIGPSPIDTELIRGVPKHKIDDLIAKQSIKKMATSADVINVTDFFLRPDKSRGQKNGCGYFSFL